MHSLAILIEYFLKENKLSEFWVVFNKNYRMNKSVCYIITLHHINIMIYGYHINYIKYTNKLPNLLFYIKPDTIYTFPSIKTIIDRFTLNKFKVSKSRFLNICSIFPIVNLRVKISILICLFNIHFKQHF